MIKLVVFDLDGVLVEARNIHYHAFNRALATIDKKYIIEREEHLSMYDGLPTRKKLEILTKEKGLPEDTYTEIWQRKQECTADIIKETVNIEDHKTIAKALQILKAEGYTIYCASNSIRHSVKLMLLCAGYM